MLVSKDEIEKSISNYGWNYVEGSLAKSYKFGTYKDSIKFVNTIAELAERKNHHPDIYIGWCNVDLKITSHDMGGVTTNCINLALEIDSCK